MAILFEDTSKTPGSGRHLLKIQNAFQYSAYSKWTMDLFLNKIRFKFGNR